jgi:hypothetical protein
VDCGKRPPPEPIFRDKKLPPLQVVDLIVWAKNLYLSNEGNIRPLYIKALDRLSETSNDWELIDLSDPDRIPTILHIPKRSPDYNYRSVIIRRDGVDGL